MNSKELGLRSPLAGRRYRVLALAGAALLIVALIVVFVLGPRWSANRQRAMAFDGIVEEKAIAGVSGGRYRPPSLRYILVIRQKTGEVIRFQVAKGIYEQARVGMPVLKRAGEQWPTLGAAASP